MYKKYYKTYTFHPEILGLHMYYIYTSMVDFLKGCIITACDMIQIFRYGSNMLQKNEEMKYMKTEIPPPPPLTMRRTALSLPTE